DRNSEKSDVAHPDSNTEVVVEKPLKDETASHGIKRRENEHRGLSHGVEDHVEQHEDHEEHDWKNEFEALSRPQLKFVFARPLVGVSGGQAQFLLQQSGSPLNEAAIVARVQVNIDITCELAVFIPDHGRATREGERCDLVNGDLRARRSGD